MKKLIVVLIMLLVLPSITLAAKGGSKPPPVDYQALIDAEEAARIDGDAALQSQIDGIQSNPVKNLKVYDADGNFLGIQAGAMPSPQNTQIFIPSLNIFTAINIGNNPSYYPRGEIWTNEFYYDTLDTLYSRYPYYLWRGPTCGGQVKYYLSSGTPVEFTPAYKVQDDESQECATSSNLGSRTLYETVEIPVSEIPFPVPVALPVSYSYE